LGSTSGTGPAKGYLSDGFHIVAACRKDGGNPWGGTTNNDGADTKGNPVWIDGGSVVFTTSRSNHNTPVANGSYTSDKRAIVSVEDFRTTYSPSRLHFMGDADGFVIVPDISDNSEINYFTYHGVYTPDNGINVTTPLVGISIPPTDIAKIANYSTNNNSQKSLAFATPTDTVSGGYISSQEHIRGSNINSFRSPAGFEEYPVVINAYEDVTFFGRLGTLPTELVTVTGGVNLLSTTPSQDRIVVGKDIPSSTNSFKFVVPWDGTTAPNSGLTKEGHQA